MLALLLVTTPAPARPTLDTLAGAWLAAQADADHAAQRAREAQRALLLALEGNDSGESRRASEVLGAAVLRNRGLELRGSPRLRQELAALTIGIELDRLLSAVRRIVAFVAGRVTSSAARVSADGHRCRADCARRRCRCLCVGCGFAVKGGAR